MGSQTLEQKNNQIATTKSFLEQLGGWAHLRDCLFAHKGIVYDLSAADLTELDTIVEKGLFIVP